jgi:hypothetical protein
MERTTKSPLPTLDPYVRETLAALRTEGIAPTDDDIGALVLLRRQCNLPLLEILAPPLGSSITAAGATWWPLHARARRWMLYAAELCGEEWRTDILLFAHTRSAPGDRSLDLMQDKGGIIAEVSEWRTELPLHDDNVEDLLRALRTLDGDYDITVPRLPEDKQQERPASELAGVNMLCQIFYGTTPEYWRSGISDAEIDELMRARDSGQWANSETRKRAIENYLRAVKWMRRCHNG